MMALDIKSLERKFIIHLAGLRVHGEHCKTQHSRESCFSKQEKNNPALPQRS